MDKINGRIDVKAWFYRYFDKVKGHEQKKCFYCGSDKVQKYGHVNGVQRYRCWVCRKQFLGGNRIDSATLWREYSELKQTYAQLAERYGCSPRTIKRKLDAYTPPKGTAKPGKVVVVIDADIDGAPLGVGKSAYPSQVVVLPEQLVFYILRFHTSITTIATIYCVTNKKPIAIDYKSG